MLNKTSKSKVILIGLLGIILVTYGIWLIFNNILGYRLILGSILNIVGGVCVINAYKNTEVYKRYKLAADERLRYKAERKRLEELQVRVNLVLEGTNIGIWEWDLKTNKVYEAHKIVSLLGYKPHEVPDNAEAWLEMIHPDDITETRKIIAEYLKDQTLFYTISHRMRGKNGYYKWLYTTGIALRDEKGIPYKVVGSHQDITQLKEKEEELDSANLRIKALLENSPDAIIIANEEQDIIYTNRATEEIFGYGFNELTGKKITNLIPNSYRESHLQGFARYLNNQNFEKISKIYDLQGLKKDGTEVPIELSLSSWIDSNRNIFFSAVIRDLTRRKIYESRLRLFANIVESSNLAVMTRDINGKINYWSDKATKLFKYTEDEVIGKDLSIILPNGEKYKHELILSCEKNNREIGKPYISDRKTKNGEIIPVVVNSWCLYDDSDEIMGDCFIYRKHPIEDIHKQEEEVIEEP